MTYREKPISLQEQASKWMLQYANTPGADLNHPAVNAIRSIAEKGELFNKKSPADDDLFLQMEALAIRSSGKSYEETLEILAKSKGMSESTVGRKIKRKTTMPPEFKALTGNDSLKKFLFHVAQIKFRSKRRND